LLATKSEDKGARHVCKLGVFEHMAKDYIYKSYSRTIPRGGESPARDHLKDAGTLMKKVAYKCPPHSICSTRKRYTAGSKHV
jgi:hypothetical protein